MRTATPTSAPQLRATRSEEWSTSRPPDRFAEGRVCSEHGCSTYLSTYNPSSVCWQHEAPRPSLVRADRTVPDDGPVLVALDDLTDLLGQRIPLSNS